MKEKLIPNVSVPEDLVQIQAYLRWERKGKQMYTPEREKASESAELCEFSLNNQQQNCSTNFSSFTFFSLFLFPHSMPTWPPH